MSWVAKKNVSSPTQEDVLNENEAEERDGGSDEVRAEQNDESDEEWQQHSGHSLQEGELEQFVAALTRKQPHLVWKKYCAKI